MRQSSPARCLGRGAVIGAALFLVGATIAAASWSEDAALNTAISDLAGDMIQPKLAPTPDGGAYISWLGNPGGGYNVYLQRVDEAGELQWNEPLLVADRSFSSTQDYGLSLDTSGNALLAFRDDRTSGIQITAARIAPSGDFLWSEDGVQLSDGDDFKAAPRIVGTSDGGAAVAWTNNNDARIVRLDAAGRVQWDDLLTQAGANGFSPAGLLAEDAGGTTGQVIVPLVQQGGFTTPRHVYGQKYDANGNRLWGDPALLVDDLGSLQFGNFPSFVGDGAGGMVISWYFTSPLQCYVQHVNAAGTLVFGPAVATSTNLSQTRSAPDVDYDPVAGEIYVFWRETDQFQNNPGVYGQRLSAAGERLWGDNGLELVPLGSPDRTQVRTLVDGAEVFAFHAEEIAPARRHYRAARLDASGKSVWRDTTLEVATADSQKGRLQVALSAAGFAMLAWEDDRGGSNDIYAQNLSAHGSLGPVDRPGLTGDLNGDGVVDVFDLLILLDAWGACPEGEACPADLDGNHEVNVFDLLILLDHWG